ncbi:MAG: hypothetical protein ACLUTU_03855 [Blautia faecis]
MGDGKAIRSVKTETVMRLMNIKVKEIGINITTLKELNDQYRRAMERMNFLQDLGLITYSEVVDIQNRIRDRYVERAHKLED